MDAQAVRGASNDRGIPAAPHTLGAVRVQVAGRGVRFRGVLSAALATRPRAKYAVGIVIIYAALCGARLLG